MSHNWLSKAIIVFFSLLFGGRLVAQTDAVSSLVEQYAPTPRASEEIRRGNVCVNQNTGAVSLEISVGEYSDRDFTIPVTLCYSYDGFKPASPSGDAGLGWSLVAGGSITREIVGIDDFDDRGYSGYSMGYSSESIYNMERSVSLIDGMPSLDGERETTSDIYHFSFPGHSGSFMIDNDGNFTTFATSGERGTYSISINSNRVFTIVTSDGYSWRFGAESGSREIMLRQNGIHDEYAQVLTEGNHQLPVVTWRLDKITAPDGRAVEFSYTSSGNYQSIPSGTDDVITSFGRGTNKVGSVTRNKFASLVRTGYLTGITVRETDNATRQVASFTWERKNYREVIENNNSYHYKKMVARTRRLVGIALSDGDTLLRTATLTYDDSRRRPLLTSVSIPVYGTWHFEYNLPSSGADFPEMISDAVDMWGYYNGNTSNGDDMIAPTDIYATSLDEYLNTYAMDPDPSYSAVGTLKKITWPTGGSSTITYEGHDASRMLLRLHYPTLQPIIDRSVASFTTSLEKVSRMLHDNRCGGVRVRKIQDDNLVDGVSSRRYVYTDETGASSGIIQEFNRYFARKIGSNKVFNPYLKYPGSSFDKSHITYSSVVEVLPDSSTVRTDYTSWEDCPDEFSAHSVQYYQPSYGEGDSYDLFMDNILREGDSRAYRRGLPKKVVVKDPNGVVSEETVFNYTEIGGAYAAYIVGSGHYWWSARRFLGDWSVSSTVRTVHPSTGASLSCVDSLTYDPYGRMSARMSIDSDGSVSTSEYRYLNGTLRPSLIESEVSRRSPTRFAPLVPTDSTAYAYSYSSGIWNKTSSTRTLYNSAGYGTVSESVLFSSHDQWGNPREITVDGNVSSILWGWDGRYPVAVIKNCGYSSLPSSVKNPIPGNLSDGQVKSLYGLTGTETRVFLWSPSVGITRDIAPSGRSVDYEYDSLKRLSAIKDASGTTLKEFSYGNEVYFLSDSLRYVRIGLNTGSAMRNEKRIYDGLGRDWMSEIMASGTVNPQALVFLRKYDGLDRLVHDYLPFAQTTQLLSAAYGRQSGYWGSLYGWSEGPHANVSYEYAGGPLALLSKETAAGKAIHDADKATTYVRSVNTSLEVPYVRYVPQGGSVLISESYSPGSLLRTEKTGPDGDKQITFETLLGRKVLTRKVSGTTMLDTYYVYDTEDRLAWIITPDAGQLVRNAAQTPGGVTWSRSGTVAASSCFVYEYDNRGDLRRVRTPGAGYYERYYDAAHRIRTDFPASSLQTGGVLYTKHSYDGVGHMTVVELYRTGLTPIENRAVPKDVLIDTVSTYTYGQSTSVDCISGDSPGTPYSVIPEQLAFSSRTGITVTPDPHVTGELIMESHRPIVEPVKPFNHTAGCLGWNYGDTMLGDTPVRTAYYYNSRGQVIQSVRSWHDGGLSRLSSSYDLEGRILSSLEEHTPPGSFSLTDWVWTENSYDTRGNLLSRSVWAGKGTSPDKAAAKLALVYAYVYDGIGRLASKSISCGNRTLTETVSCTIQGWTSELAYSLSGGDVFSESIRYWDPVKVPSGRRYGGTISEATFSHDGYEARTEAYSYDGFERLTGTSAFIGGGTSPVTVNVEDGITYDAMGNVTALTRHGPSGTAAAQLSMTYSGNHRTQVTDSVTGNTWTGTYREDGTLMTDGRSGYSYADNLIGLVSQVAHTFSGPGGDDLLVSGSYTYLPDGTKTEGGSLITRLYRGSVVYKKILADQLSLETLSLPDVIVSVTDTVWTPLAMVTDHLGSVRAVVSMKTGGIVERNDYYTYGTRITKPASDATAYPSLSSNRWRYAAKEEQSGVTGIPYYDFGARQYDPFTASWLAPDPLAGDYPGISPYVYCAGDPVNLVDKNGMKWATPRLISVLEQELKKRIESLENGDMETNEAAEFLVYLRQAQADIKTLTDDDNYYVLSYDWYDMHYVKLGCGGLVIIETSSDAISLHEIHHVAQSLTAGGLLFTSDNYLKNAALNQIDQSLSTEELYEAIAQQEIDSYRIQYSMDKSFPGSGVKSLNDINVFSVGNIKNRDGKPVYKPIWQLAIHKKIRQGLDYE